MKKSILLLTASLGLAIAPGAGAAGNLILNGNFATGDFTHWTKSGDLFIYDFESGVTLPGTDSYVAGTGGNASISQTIATTVGRQYTLSFLSNNDYDHSSGGSFSGKIDGNPLFTSASIYVSTVNSFLTQSYTFTAANSSTEVELDLNFGYVGRIGQAYIDDISVTELSPVPEPSEWAAASVALLGLVYVAKRRFAQA